jgi:hypothetical protein
MRHYDASSCSRSLLLCKARRLSEDAEKKISSSCQRNWIGHVSDGFVLSPVCVLV